MMTPPQGFDRDHRAIWSIIQQHEPHTEVMEIGCHQGDFSRMMAHRFDRCVFVEGDHQQCDLLHSEVHHPHEVHCAVMWRDRGRHRWFTSHTVGEGGGSVILPGVWGEGWSSQWRNTLTVDDLPYQPTLIKMDCEGADVAIVMGADDTIHRNRPVIIMEWAGGDRAEMMGVTESQWQQFWGDHRYVIQWVQGPAWSSDQWRSNTGDSYNLVMRPQSYT